MSELFTVQEAADRLRIGKRSAEREIARGDLRSILIGRRRFVRAEDLDRYLELAARRGRVA